MSIYPSKERNNHARVFATVTDAEDTDAVHFSVIKRDRQIMAERSFWRGEESRASVEMGRHTDRRWSGSVTMRWNF